MSIRLTGEIRKMSISNVNNACAVVLIIVLFASHMSAFHIDDCMRNQQNNSILHIREAHIHPANVIAPGNLNVRVNFEILRDISSDFELSVVVWRKVLFLWLTLSRSTHSLCGLLDTEFLQVDGSTSCPPQLANAGLPCRCPFTRGHYSLPLSSFYIVKPHYLLYGRYWVQAQLRDTSTGVLKACQTMRLTLSRP
ncbi:ganglioside GM2 activator-like [Argopecten irradians]|uniref:ganglioside GM2 activator-like n=1 Tax=Argopecten irradians TaxID=31199 RepID=UPI0037244F43